MLGKALNSEDWYQFEEQRDSAVGWLELWQWIAVRVIHTGSVIAAGS